MTVQKPLKRQSSERLGFDPLLFCLILLLSLFGSLMVFSASYAYASHRYGDSFYFIKRQALWLPLWAAML